MDWQNLAQGVLLIVARFVVVWFLNLINANVPVEVIDAIVGALVAWLLSLVFTNTAARAVRAFRAR